MPWVKATIKYPDGFQLARKVGDDKSIPMMFVTHVIADHAGKTYKKDEVEWFDSSEPSFTLADMKEAHKSGQLNGFEKCSQGMTNETFVNFMKTNYGIEITDTP